jgi:hypothetical protein
MNSYEDIVWNNITDSAKRRFDYTAFELGLSDFDDGTMVENILFMTIIGHAQKQSIEQIATSIRGELFLLAITDKEGWLDEFVKARLDDSPIEIKAAKQAIALTEMGINTPGILVQIRSILKNSE